MQHQGAPTTRSDGRIGKPRRQFDRASLDGNLIVPGELLILLGVLTLGLLSPGPDFFIVVRNSVGGSRSRGFATVGGIVTGLGVHTLLIAFGIGALSPTVMQGVSVAGACFLTWVGLRALATRPAAGTVARSSVAHPLSARRGFWEGLGCNLSNPKAFLFFASLFARFIPAGVINLWSFLLPAIVVLHGAVIWSAIVLALQSAPVARRLLRWQHWLPRLFGMALLAFAAWMLLDLAHGWHSATPPG